MVPGFLPQTMIKIDRPLLSGGVSGILATKVHQVALSFLKSKEGSVYLPFNPGLLLRSLRVMSSEKSALFERGHLSMMIRGISH